MLEPESRHALLDNLRPPAGFVLDRAVGTTYSLDLMALLTAPLAFALFDSTRADGSGLDIDPIALLEAVRRHAEQIDVFCQAGQISPMHGYRPIVSYLESSVHAAVPLATNAIFHPKIWVLRYRDPDSEQKRYRFLCLTRNLTFDQSWDTALVLDGAPGRTRAENAPLADFVRALPTLVTGEVDGARLVAIRDLADELADVEFALPPGFRKLRFWPLGHDGEVRWPFENRIDRLLVISPFLTAPLLSRLRGRRTSDSLVSRAETLDHLGSAAVSQFETVFTLSPDASAPAADADGSPGEGSVDVGHGSYLEGLHAKCFVGEVGQSTRVWTGSANATDAAFGGNVEFLVELVGKRDMVGIDAVMVEQPGQPTLRTLLEPYAASNAEPVPLSPEEEIDRDLDVIRRQIGALNWVADASEIAPDVFSVRLTGIATRPDQAAMEPSGVRCWPMALPGAAAPLSKMGPSLAVDFPSLSLEALSSFFTIEAKLERSGIRRTLSFVVNAHLLGAPADRKQRLLATLLSNREDLLRFLLMLLGDAGFQATATGDGSGTGQWSWAGAGSATLLEPMIRALAGNPSRLDDIAGLVGELGRTPEGIAALPEGWAEVWEPIWAARKDLAP